MTTSKRALDRRLSKIRTEIDDLTPRPVPVLIWVHDEKVDCEECRNRSRFGEEPPDEIHGRVVTDYYHESGCIFGMRRRLARSDDDDGEYFDRDGNLASDRLEELVSDG